MNTKLKNITLAIKWSAIGLIGITAAQAAVWVSYFVARSIAQTVLTLILS
tara:strand:+ start:5517 stop:5666 length:150 start_codon:yes stop_codon:yes gene_type:complete